MKRFRRGFTLVELLVVIAIMGTMMAILLPAVQGVRESARRLNCASNLKNIGLAMEEYHGALRKYPVGADVDGFGRTNPFLWHSVWVYLLPYIDQRPLYDRYDFTAKNYTGDEANLSIIRTKISLFLCPTDQSDRTLEGIKDVEWARSNYAVCFGSDTVIPSKEDQQSTFGNVNRLDTDGPFRVDRARRDRDFYRGASSTILASEVIAGEDDNFAAGSKADFRGVWAFPYAGASIYTHRHLPNNNVGDSSTGDGGGDAMPKFWCVDSRPDRDDLPCDGFAGFSHEKSHAAARSRHMAGVNVLYGDKRVEFISNDVELKVWREWSRLEDTGEDDEEEEG